MQFYENRLPLSGVKVPFNLNQDYDNYKEDLLIFHVRNKKGILKVTNHFMIEKKDKIWDYR